MEPSREGVFKYLDELERRNTPPDEYLNRVTGRFLVSSEVAQSYIVEWVGEVYKALRIRAAEEYRQRLHDLERMHGEQLIDIERRNTETIAKFIGQAE